MKRLLISLWVATVLLAGVALAKEIEPSFQNESEAPIDPGLAQAAVDTTYLLGGPGSWDGRFETPDGQPDWHGWTHEDVSVSMENHWHVSDYMADMIPGHGPGNQAMYCGDETIPACSALDEVGGYGPGWLEEIEWRRTVADPGVPVTVELTGVLRYDTEPGYDYVYLMVQRGESQEVLQSWTDEGTATLDFQTTLIPGEFTGPNEDEVRLFWRFLSDGAYDDIDCNWYGSGACQIDDLTVSFDGLEITFDDFEPGSPVNWTPSSLPGVGDFASLRDNLETLDPCSINYSYQGNFIDDGLVVPGTGGTPCIDWCYGPGGYIVNHDGGLMADYDMDFHLKNQVVSPPLAWPGDIDGAHLSFDIYIHEPFSATSSGVFGYWMVRSTTSADPADLQDAPWDNRNFLIEHSLGRYRRFEEPVSDLLVPGRQWVQIALGAHEAGFQFGFNGPNGTPSPYYDNVSFKVWDPVGPEIEVERYTLFGDAFPEAGTLNETDLAANWCRVDMSGKLFNGGRGDSLVAHIEPLRHGAVIVEPPALHWAMRCNPVFDSVRPEAPDGQGILRGMTAGSVVVDNWGTPVLDRFAFDLPDTGFFFPGDRLQYYITAADDLDGDVRMAVWPPDTNSVLDFAVTSPYPYRNRINGLPAVTQPVPGVFFQPEMLLIDDSLVNPDSRSRWLEALDLIGIEDETDMDVLTIFSPEDLTLYLNVDLLAGYDTLVHSTGDNTASMDHLAPTLIEAWLDTGDKRGLFAGQSLASRLSATNEGSFLLSRLGVHFVGSSLSNLFGGIWSYLITPTPGNDVFPEALTWQIDAACPKTRFMDAINHHGTGLSAAAMGHPGWPDAPYSAVVTLDDQVYGNRTAFMSFNLDAINGMTTQPGQNAKSYLPATTMVYYLMFWLGADVTDVPDDVPGAGGLTVSAHPNPFNPSTTIAFELPRALEVSLDIYDLQGRLVRRLLDESPFVAGGHHQVWDGRDGQGRATSSGVYFFRFTAGDQKRVGKLTLLK